MSDLREQVQVLVDDLVAGGSENGVQAAVYHRGELVVDVVSGRADADRPMTSDTPVYSASAGKAVTATVVHVLVERGVFDYDTPVVEFWPEYGARGKESTTLRHVLSHSAGVPTVPLDTTPEMLCDWDAMCRLIAGLEARWTPGERVGYHAQTFGFLAGEVVRRATGKTVSRVLADEIAAPLGVGRELYLGVPEAEVDRVARSEDDPAGMAAFKQFAADMPLFKESAWAITPHADYANRRDVLTADIPAGATFSARGVARMYAALLGEVDGVRLVSADRLADFTTVVNPDKVDEMSGAPSTYSLGYSVGHPWTSGLEHPTVFGFVGFGVGAAFADTATGVTVAITRNRFNPIEMRAVQGVTDLVAQAFS